MYMYDAPCEIKDCSKIARGEDTYCQLCRRHLCRAHYDRKRHLCRYQGRPDWYQEKWETLADLDLEAVKREAEALRPGHTCTVVQASRDHSVRPFEVDEGMGVNIHVPITFDDGEEWLLRIPSYSDKPFPPDMTAQTRESEVCTYQALYAAGVAVPKVYSWGSGTLSKKKDPCFSHIIYEKLPGAPVWDMNALSSDQIDKMIDTYAEQMIKISEVSFDAIGGLKLDENGKIVVGGMVDSRDTNAPDQANLGGPFHSMREYYLYQIDACLAAIKAGMLFRRDLYTSFLAYRELRELVASSPVLNAEEDSKFYLVHPDGGASNILITEDGRISALLDWEWAQTTCKTAAFRSPRWIVFANYLIDYAGQTDREEKLCAAYESRGRKDLADCVRDGRVYNLLTAFLSEDVYGVDDKFPEQFHALVKVLDPDSREERQTRIRQWQIRRENRYPDDTVMKGMADMGLRVWKSQKQSRVAYPLQRWASRVWKECRKAVGQ